ncbi:MAG TPA: hypothetical protein VNS63_11225 [Blastocatellia bacterium]|nr:hypothetical protein [Blastocatellia bacterium]
MGNKHQRMVNNKVDRLLFAYFERPKKEYARILESIKASGGLNNEEIETIRAKVPYVHAETIIRHLRACQ